MSAVRVDQFIASHRMPPEKIILDFDAIDVRMLGDPKGPFFCACLTQRSYLQGSTYSLYRYISFWVWTRIPVTILMAPKSEMTRLPADAITEAIEHEQADLVVMGARGASCDSDRSSV